MEFKIVLVGDSGVGKTTWLMRHKTGHFGSAYTPTLWDYSVPLKFNTNYGSILLNVYDLPGNIERFDRMMQDHKSADGAIVMFDLTNKQSFDNVPQWLLKLDLKIGFIPTVFCGNKFDIKVKKMPSDEIKHRLNTENYYNISAKNYCNFDMLFLNLMQRLTKHDDLRCLEGDPPEIPVKLPPKLTKCAEAKTKVQEDEVSLTVESLPVPTKKYVNMIALPNGGVMKIIHEYYPNDEILKRDKL